MKAIVEFFKVTLVGGLFVLLPVSLLFLLLAEMLDLAIAVATPLTLIFPEGTFDGSQTPVILAVVLIVVTSMVIGLLMKSGWGRAMGSWLERHILSPIPGYGFLKNLTHSLGGSAEANHFRAAFKNLPGGGWQAVYVVEESEGKMCTILVPHAPAAMSGPVEIVPRDRLRILSASFGGFMHSINHWGSRMSQFADLSTTEPNQKTQQT
jgi:uncharacterized membrane protein